MIREDGAMVLNATLVDKSDMRGCNMVALVVPIDVSAAVEVQDEDTRGSEILAHLDALQIPVLDGACEVRKSRQPAGTERRKHELTHLPHVPSCTICCRARAVDDPHHAVIHDESIGALPKIER